MVLLSPFDLSIAASLLFLMIGLNYQLKLGMGWQIVIAGVRTTVQLLLIGVVLKALFSNVEWYWIVGISLVMLLAAGREVLARQKNKFRGIWGFQIGISSIFVSSFTITGIALVVILKVEPWYTPQYAIPLLGMLMGNTINGITLTMNHLVQNVKQQRFAIEQRLLLGQTWKESLRDIQRDSLRTGMIPIVNSMSTAGLVALPGMMTGQILSGSPPLEAVKYQIMIMFLIAAGVTLGSIVALTLTSRLLFDERHRLRLNQVFKEA